jgi:hypothetical protein
MHVLGLKLFIPRSAVSFICRAQINNSRANCLREQDSGNFISGDDSSGRVEGEILVRHFDDSLNGWQEWSGHVSGLRQKGGDKKAYKVSLF